MANPIQLLIELNANKGKSNSNIDSYVKELRRRYESNPLSLNIDSKSANSSFQKLTESAKKLQSELSKVGTVGSDKLTAFSNAITGIGNSSLSAQAKIVHLTRAMDSIKTASNSVKFNEGFADGIQRSVASLNTLEAKLKNLGKGGSVKYDTQSLADATSRLNALRTSLAQVSNPTQLQRLNRQFRELSNDVGTLQGKTNSFGNSISEAFKKFPVWILAANVFYAPIRGLADLTKQTIELDTAITNLARVSNLNDFQLDRVLQKSIENVDTLSAKTSEYLELVNEFARTGKDDTESLALANTATILQNISDLNANEAFDSLTAAQIAFNIEAEKSITIADKLNEVDNNYSITTKDLSLSLNKAASTAKTFGVSLDELIGLGSSSPI